MFHQETSVETIKMKHVLIVPRWQPSRTHFGDDGSKGNSFETHPKEIIKLPRNETRFETQVLTQVQCYPIPRILPFQLRYDVALVPFLLVNPPHELRQGQHVPVRFPGRYADEVDVIHLDGHPGHENFLRVVPPEHVDEIFDVEHAPDATLNVKRNLDETTLAPESTHVSS